MRVTCTNCGGAHTPWDCKRPAKKSTERKNKPVANGDAPDVSLGLEDRASSANQAVDTSSTVAENGVDSFPSQPYVSPTSAGTVGNKDRQPNPGRARATEVIVPSAEGATPSPGANAGSSNGRTAPFDGVNTGSSPVPAPIQKRPRGRPKSITDMAAYKRAKQREYRAKWRAIRNRSNTTTERNEG